MKRMIRGKVVAERKKDGGELIENSLSSAQTTRPGKAAETEPSEIETTELNPLRDGNTFAPPSAPWVGAERAWRRGIVPPPHEEWKQYKTRAEEAFDRPISDLALTDEEVATVLTSLPPPAEREGSALPLRRYGQWLPYAAVVVLTAVTAWALFGGSRANAPNRQETRSQPMNYQTAALLPAVSERAPDPVPAAVPFEVCAVKDDVENAPQKTFKASTSARESRAVPAAGNHAAVPRTSAAAVKSDSPSPLPAPVPAVATPSEPEAESTGSPDETNHLFHPANPYLTDETESTTAEAIEPSSESLTRQAVNATMDEVAPEVAACGNGASGQIVMRLVVSGSTGRVTRAEAAYAPYVDTPVGSCAARAVKRAQFPSFAQHEMTIKYPFNF